MTPKNCPRHEAGTAWLAMVLSTGRHRVADEKASNPKAPIASAPVATVDTSKEALKVSVAARSTQMVPKRSVMRPRKLP